MMQHTLDTDDSQSKLQIQKNNFTPHSPFQTWLIPKQNIYNGNSQYYYVYE